MSGCNNMKDDSQRATSGSQLSKDSKGDSKLRFPISFFGIDQTDSEMINSYHKWKFPVSERYPFL